MKQSMKAVRAGGAESQPFKPPILLMHYVSQSAGATVSGVADRDAIVALLGNSWAYIHKKQRAYYVFTNY